MALESVYKYRYCSLQRLTYQYISLFARYDEGDVYGRPPMPPPGDMWGYRPPFEMPFDPRWGRVIPPPFMPPPPDFRIPVTVVFVCLLQRYLKTFLYQLAYPD